MKIEQYISQLLYRYQCVTVPGFGAFLTEYHSAQINENSNTFYPPKKQLSFNPYIKNNDGLLANHIAQCEKIGYEVAVSIIQNEVLDWKNKIQVFGVYALNSLGEFSLNMEKNIVFVPYEQINYLKEAFGLSSYISPSVKREVPVEKIEIKVEDEETPIVLNPEKRRNFKPLKYAAVITLSLGLTSVLGYKLYDNYLHQIEQETLIVQSNVQKKINQKIQEATFVIENPIPAVTLNVGNEKLSYHIVAGAYRSESNAENCYQSLLRLGYKAQRIAPNKHGLFPVLYGSYSSYSEAHKAMETIQKTHNPEAWLLIQEL